MATNLLRAQPEDEIAADVIASDADVSNGNEQASPAQQAIMSEPEKTKTTLPFLWGHAISIG